jgi:TonB-dependent SusC/RagA subfamily outer membrane receptor
LFSASGEPLNERLVFIRNPGQLNLKVATADSIYHTRQKVKINLTASDEFYKPVAGDFSVEVTDETRVPVDEDNESTILSHLLLTSDLEGYVEKPNYYFTWKNDRAGEDLDVLMLTQGYHRFEWKQILNNKVPAPAFQPEKMTAVSGKITHLNGKPVPYGKVSLTSVSHVFFYLDTVADAGGKFVFKHLPEIDSMRYMIQATDKQVRKNTLIEIDKVKPPKLTGNKNAPDGTIKQSDNLITYLNFSTGFHQEQLKQGINKHAIMLKEVSVKDKAQKKYLHHSDNLNGAGNANEVITADQLPLGCPVLVDCILGRLHGIKFVDGTPFYGNLYGHMETAVFIDGVEITGRIVLGYNSKTNTPIYSEGVSKEEIINMLSVNDIASIEIITDASLAAIYGVRGGGGVILISTKRGDDVLSNLQYHQAFAYYAPVGYYKARVFYSPKYDAPKTNTTFTDLRTTIYWNPEIVTDKDGNTSFEFFNADTKGTYRIVVEGIDGKGHLGRQVYHYKVE